MWKDFRLLRTFHVEKFEITPHVEKFCIRICHAYKSEISPHDKFFFTNMLDALGHDDDRNNRWQIYASTVSYNSISIFKIKVQMFICKQHHSFLLLQTAP